MERKKMKIASTSGYKVSCPYCSFTRTGVQNLSEAQTVCNNHQKGCHNNPDNKDCGSCKHLGEEHKSRKGYHRCPFGFQKGGFYMKDVKGWTYSFQSCEKWEERND